VFIRKSVSNITQNIWKATRAIGSSPDGNCGIKII
jgi:hypothetical protein